MGVVRAQAVAAPEAEQVEQHISDDIHGFKLERQQWVPEYNSTVLLYKHKATGLLALIWHQLYFGHNFFVVHRHCCTCPVRA